MATGDKFVSITPKRLLGFLDFRDRWLNYFKKIYEDITENAFGQNGFFNTAVTMSATGNDLLEIDNDIAGTDAQGHIILTNEYLAGRAPSNSGWPVENVAAEVYSVALQYAEKPEGIQINSRTGYPEFLEIAEHVGVRDEPTSVTDNGDGTMTFNVNSVARPFADDISNAHMQVGRTVLVWKKTPGQTAVTEAMAVLTGVIVDDSGDNSITVGTASADIFGQTPGSASVNTSDYFVLLEGPTVSYQDLSVEPFTLFVGTFTGTGAGNPPGTFDIGGQNTLGPVASDLGQITATHHGNLKVRVRADGSDVDETQIEVQNAAAAKTWGVDEDGDMTVEGVSTFNGNAIFGAAASFLNLAVSGITGLGGAAVSGKALKTYTDTEIGDDETDAHTFFGTLTGQNNALDPNILIDALNGLININQGTGAGKLRVGGNADLNSVVNIGTELDGGVASAGVVPRVNFGPLNALSALNGIFGIKGSGGIGVDPDVNFYVSEDGSEAWVTINALYTTSGFLSLVNTLPAFGLNLRLEGGLSVWEKAATVGTWASFDTEHLNVDFPTNTITSSSSIVAGTDLEATAAVVAGTSVTAGTLVQATTAVIAGTSVTANPANGFLYSSARTEYKWIAGMHACVEQAGNPAAIGGAGLGARDLDNNGTTDLTIWDPGSGGGRLYLEHTNAGAGFDLGWELLLPDGASLLELQTAYTAADAANFVLNVFRTSHATQAATALRTTAVSLPVHDSTASGLHASWTPTSAVVIDNSLYRYTIRVNWYDAAISAADSLYGFRARYTVPELVMG